MLTANDRQRTFVTLNFYIFVTAGTHTSSLLPCHMIAGDHKLIWFYIKFSIFFILNT